MRVGDGSAQGKGKIAVPWFALGFLALVVVNSLHVLPDAATSTINTLDTFALTMAMTALGMETRIAQIREAGPRALATGAILYAWLFGGGLAITLGVEAPVRLIDALRVRASRECPLARHRF